MLMTLAIFFLFKQYSGTDVRPLTSADATSASVAPILTRYDSLPDCSGRTVLNIIWSCLATTFACTWISVHPNTPFRGEGRWTLLRRRIYLMFLSVFAPEFMIMWAFKQWRGAVMIRETINEAFPDSDPWTTTHGHFLQMGGFRLHTTARENFVETYHTPELRTRKLISPGAQYQPQNGSDTFKANTHLICQITGKYRPRVISERDISRIDFGDDIWEGVLTISSLKTLLSENLIHFPSITEDEINDRSKGDALSKGIALLQLTWFIMQVIARAVQGLAITELELTTAALAGLNGIMYFFWWSKPRDVQFPVVIRTKGVEHQLSSTSDDRAWIFSDVAFSFRKQLWTTIAHHFAQVSGNLRSFLGSLLRKGAHGFVVLALGFRTLHFRFTRLSSQIARRLSFLRGKSSDIETANQIPLDEDATEYDPQLSNSIREVKTRSILNFVKAMKSAINIIALFLFFPIFCLFYLIHLALLVPISQILANDWSGDNQSSFELDMKGEQELFSMMFYSEDAGITPLLSSSSIAGVLFGTVHCLAWNFHFASHMEMIIWRYASLGVVGACVMCFTGAHSWARIVTLQSHVGSVIGGFIDVMSMLIFALTPLVYAVARMTLLVLAVTSLRLLPPSAYNIVQFTQLVPHI